MSKIKTFFGKIAPALAALGALGGLPLVALAFVMYLWWSQAFFESLGYFMLWSFLGGLISLATVVENKLISFIVSLVPIMAQVAMISSAIFISLDQLPMTLMLFAAWISAVWSFTAGLCFWYFIRHWSAFVALFRFRGPNRQTPPPPPTSSLGHYIP